MSKARKFIIFDIALLLVIGGILFIKGFPVGLHEKANEEAVIEDEIEEKTEEADETDETSAAIIADEWNLILVNPWNAIPEDYAIETAETESGYLVDSRVKEPLEEMLSACRDAGYDPLIISAFRTRETQQYLYDHTANKNDTAVPGHSEHECGLAIDIIDAASSGWADPLIDEQENQPAQKWLMENCQEYGFILRYPKDKEDITGIIYEPWHYRYIGKEHAGEVMKKAVCLEEYLGRTEKTEEGESD